MTDLAAGAPGAPPGWYRDPWGQATWRWWSGVEWTPHTDGTPPVAPSPWGPKAEPGQPLRAGGIAILGFLVGLAISTVITLVLLLFGYTAEDPALLLGSTVGLWIGLFGSCLIAVRVKGTGSLRDLGLTKPRGVDLALGVGFAVAGVIMVSLLAAILNLISHDLIPGGRTDLTDPADHAGVLGIVVVYVIACVGAPFFEELFFRGLVQGTLTARWGIGVGLVVQAMLFGSVHLNPQNGWGNVGTFVIITAVGLGLGAIRILSKRLPPGMFTHAGYNAIIVTIAMFGRDLQESLVHLLR
jgi:membrane protease YdiL (CAAX protease family)